MKQHADIRTSLAAQLRGLLGRLKKLPLELRPYQIETLQTTCGWLEDPGGTRRAYVEQATGLGKTVFFAALAGCCVGLRILIVVPSRILVEQTARDVHAFTGGMLGYVANLPEIHDEQGHLIAVSGMRYTDIVVTTDESFRYKTNAFRNQFQPDVIIFDECHWAFVGLSSEALQRFPEAVIIGFSATPDYLSNFARAKDEPVKLANGQTLYAQHERRARTLFETRLDCRSLPWGVGAGWLAPLAWGRIRFNVSLKDIPIVPSEAGLDFQASALAQRMEHSWSAMTRAVCKLYLTGAYDLHRIQTFATCPSVVTAEELARAVKAIGIPTACITGDTPPHIRRRILAAYAANEIRLLTSVLVLREGWNAPNAEACLMLRPTQSYVRYVQTCGRVVRAFAGKPNKVALILDGAFEDRQLEPLSAPSLFADVGSEVPVGGLLLNARDDATGPARRADVSPYIVHGANDSVRVLPFNGEVCADNTGQLEADGLTWVTEFFLRHKFTVASYLRSLASRGSIRSRPGRTSSGKPTVLYALTDVEKIEGRRWNRED